MARIEFTKRATLVRFDNVCFYLLKSINSSLKGNDVGELELFIFYSMQMHAVL